MNSLKKTLAACLGVFGLFLGTSVYAAPPTTEELTTAITAQTGQVEALASVGAAQASSLLVSVASFGLVLLIVGAGIYFIWKFFMGSKARC